MLRISLLTFYFLLLTSPASALTDAWSVDARQHTAVQRTYKQGESWTMQVTLRDGLKPLDLTGSQVLFYWFTNSTDNLWWTNSASASGSTVTAQWTPAMDVGASSYAYWIGIWTTGATSPLWRVAGTIRMLPSPGFTPNALPLPARTLDFSTVALTNAPWATTNALAGALQSASATNDLFAAWFGTLFSSTSNWSTAFSWGDWHSAVAACATNPVTRLYATAGTTVMDLSNSVPRIFESGTFTNWTVALNSSFSPRPWAGTAPHAFPFESGDWTGYFDNNGSAVISYLFGTVVWQSPVGGLASPQQVAFDDDLSDGDGAGYATVAATTHARKETAEVLTDLSGYKQMAGTEIGSGSITFEPNMNASITISHGGISYYSLAAGMIDFLWPSDSGTLATTQDVAKAIAAIPAPDLSGLATSAALAEATNRIVQTYLISSNAWIIADFSNQTVSVSMVNTNGTTNTVSVGSGNSNAIDPSATNLLWLALNAGLAGKASKAWGRDAPDGSSNPDPEYMTFLNAPATVFASGAQWSTYGTYAVLSATGTVAFASGDSGQFRLGPNSTNWFGFVQGGSVTVGAVAQSLSVAAGGTPEGTATVVYPYSGGDFPALWFSPSIGAVDFATVEGVVWVDNQNGTATVTAPATTAKGFWYATTTATFDNVFESTMPARFSGGILGTTNALPVIYDSVIEVSSGGHTYRIPAQLAD